MAKPPRNWYLESIITPGRRTHGRGGPVKSCLKLSAETGITMGLARKKEGNEKDDALLQIREKTDMPSKTVCKGSGPHTASQSAKAAGNVASCGIRDAGVQVMDLGAVR